ncbi:MAG: hypothetical protein QOF01_3941 [Thermomicrobiales bacterium]|nr:hypothetical protein [Thermomicrobiales bacterium]
MRRIAVMLAVLLVVIAQSAVASAQDGAAASLPVVPDPSECRITPRPAEEARKLMGALDEQAGEAGGNDDSETDRQPYPSQPHRAADPVVSPGIVATARELIACINAGDFNRQIALYTDALLLSGGLDPDDLDDPVDPLPSERLVMLLDVTYAREFPDGRVGAIVILDDPIAESPAEPLFLVFQFASDRWLIDDFGVFGSTTTVATPATGSLVAFASDPLDIPDPADCRVEARDRDELEALVDSSNSPSSEEFPQTPEVLPTTMPNRPADETATQGVAATARQLVACINTGDLLRVSALYTDDFLRSVTFEPDNLDAENAPMSPEERMAYLGVLYVRAFDDGRVGAVVVLDDPFFAGAIEPIFLLFEQNGDHWLIDGAPDPLAIYDEEDVEIESIVVEYGTPATADEAGS